MAFFAKCLRVWVSFLVSGICVLWRLGASWRLYRARTSPALFKGMGMARTPYAWVLRVLKRLGCRGMPCVCCACDRQVESLTKVQSDHAKPSRVLSGIVTGFGGIV